MKNNKVILSVVAGIAIAGGIIAWLMLGGVNCHHCDTACP